MNSRTATILFRLCIVGVAGLLLSGFRSAALVLALLGLVVALFVRRSRARFEADRFAFAKVIVARQLLADGDAFKAMPLATDATAHAKTRQTRNAGLTTLAWAALAQGYNRRAKAALDAVEPNYEIDLHCSAAVDVANGHHEDALRALEIATSARSLNQEGAKLLIDLYAQHRGFDRALLAAIRNQSVLGTEASRHVVKVAYDAGEYGSAAILAAALFQTTGAPDDAAALLRALAFGPEVSKISRALDDIVQRLRRLADGKTRAKQLVVQLQADRSLPSAARTELDRVLPLIEGLSAG